MKLWGSNLLNYILVYQKVIQASMTYNTTHIYIYIMYHYNSHIFHHISSFLTFSTKILIFHCYDGGFFISLQENKRKILKIPF